MKNLILTSLLSLIIALPLIAQEQPAATDGVQRFASYQARKAAQNRSLVNEIKFENIGPTVFSGRVVDIDVHPEDPTIFYVAYASGGLWKTENNGTSFEPIFDNEAVMTIGDIAVNWKHDIIWVGTGENNSSRSSYSGVGMYNSLDGGKTWDYKGLPESHHIGRIIIDEDQPDMVIVGAMGHLYSSNEERGIYKTTDGGANWEQTLYVNDNSGAIELIQDPNDSNTLYAGMWERTRRSWDFTESGEGTGIYKSTDAGNTWNKVSNAASGFPDGEGAGRIGMAAYDDGDQTILYAIIDNYFRRPKEEKKDEDDTLTKDELRPMSKAAFIALDEKKIQGYLTANRFPKKYSAKKVKEMIQADEIMPKTLVEFTENANSLLFETPVIGAEVYKSTDGGLTWTKTHDKFLDFVYNSYGYYFGQIRTSAHQKGKLYIMGVPVMISEDDGVTWESINGDNVHADHHALYVSPHRDKHIILGNDGGINISYDDGKHWNKCNTPALGQFYDIEIDDSDNYKVYGGLQDNGVWMGSHNYKASTRWHSTGQYPYKSILGGDGMQVQVDNRDKVTVYTGFQFGNYFRINTTNNSRKRITPIHDLGEPSYRWNWQAPILLSKHNQDIVYFGSQYLHRSMDQGDNFSKISDDLTKGGRKGDVAFGTLTAIDESPFRFGLIYVGTDDGNIHVTRDAGYHWDNISKGLPQDMWVSRVVASKYTEGRVYATLNGYRWDDFSAYVYVSEDYGNNWKAIASDLPVEPVNVIAEDPNNAKALYIGTDHGLYVSMDMGMTTMLMNNELPAVAVHDVEIHKGRQHLLVGTHGRSIYKADIKHLQAMNDAIFVSALHVFDIDKVNHSTRWGAKRAWFMDASEPEIKLPIYTSTGGPISINIKDKEDNVIKTIKSETTKGLNYIEYDLTRNVLKSRKRAKDGDTHTSDLKAADNGKFYIQIGEYTVDYNLNGVMKSTKLTVKKR